MTSAVRMLMVFQWLVRKFKYSCSGPKLQTCKTQFKTLKFSRGFRNLHRERK